VSPRASGTTASGLPAKRSVVNTSTVTKSAVGMAKLSGSDAGFKASPTVNTSQCF